MRGVSYKTLFFSIVNKFLWKVGKLKQEKKKITNKLSIFQIIIVDNADYFSIKIYRLAWKSVEEQYKDISS